MEEKFLPPELFCRVHRSYIVNMMHIDGFDSKEIHMKNGDRIPVSKPKEFRAAYNAFNFRIMSD